jgi:hypothetical protein
LAFIVFVCIARRPVRDALSVLLRRIRLVCAGRACQALPLPFIDVQPFTLAALGLCDAFKPFGVGSALARPVLHLTAHSVAALVALEFVGGASAFARLVLLLAGCSATLLVVTLLALKVGLDPRTLTDSVFVGVAALSVWTLDALPRCFGVKLDQHVSRTALWLCEAFEFVRVAA